MGFLAFTEAQWKWRPSIQHEVSQSESPFSQVSPVVNRIFIYIISLSSFWTGPVTIFCWFWLFVWVICRRGLSNFFTSKSQLFMSLVDVKRVEDLAKPKKKLKSSHSWESTIKSSFNNQAIRSSILSAGSAETIKKPYKASNGGKTRKKGSRLVPRNSYRLQQSPPKQII